MSHVEHCSQFHEQKFVESLELSLRLLLKLFSYDEHGLQPSRFRGIFGILMLLDALREYLPFLVVIIDE